VAFDPVTLMTGSDVEALLQEEGLAAETGLKDGQKD
jgi:hypothetical protein